MPKPSPGRPSRQALRERALLHTGRYATTEAGLARVLTRFVARSAGPADAEAAVAAASDIAEIVAELAAAGAVQDASFASGRARRLSRAGRSNRAVAAHLHARGVPADLIVQALPTDELAAAVAAMRRRRFGAFRSGVADADRVRKELAALTRAGFPLSVARQALALNSLDAEQLIAGLRSG
ncbi:MAG: RecX family transcriptional regulator [Acidisphaera sp.]|nr:RecX family transcriptional regulator [Acidisphaera sp.]MBV9813693.1 RecX family transcriptional regulator [Acetobacteraceae bacterium]